MYWKLPAFLNTKCHGLSETPLHDLAQTQDNEARVEMPSLKSQMSGYQEESRRRRPDYAKAYDELVGRLTALDRGQVGPQVGEPMPAFVMPDENGQLVSLAALLRKGPLLISFNRGHWCPYCKMDLRALAANYDKIRQLGANVVSIMPEAARYTTEYTKDNDLPFPVLSDIDLGYALSLGLIFWVGSEVERLYRESGVELDRYQGNGSFFLPIAAKFIVGCDGLVKARHVNVEFRERMEPDAILAVLQQLADQG